MGYHKDVRYKLEFLYLEHSGKFMNLMDPGFPSILCLPLFSVEIRNRQENKYLHAFDTRTCFPFSKIIVCILDLILRKYFLWTPVTSPTELSFYWPLIRFLKYIDKKEQDAWVDILSSSQYPGRNLKKNAKKN